MKNCDHKLYIRLHQLEAEKCLLNNQLCEDNQYCYYKKLQRIEEYCNNKKCRYDGETENCLKKEIMKIISAEAKDNITMYGIITDESEE